MQTKFWVWSKQKWCVHLPDSAFNGRELTLNFPILYPTTGDRSMDITMRHPRLGDKDYTSGWQSNQIEEPGPPNLGAMMLSLNCLHSDCYTKANYTLSCLNYDLFWSSQTCNLITALKLSSQGGKLQKFYFDYLDRSGPRGHFSKIASNS